MLIVRHAIPRKDVLLGVVRAESVRMDRYPADFGNRLDRILAERAHALAHDEEARRTAARDILRNGSYKPTGRKKPASEYLLRAASEGGYSFPRINGPVDICNYLSLKHVLPISLWDLDRAGASHYVFRLGRTGEGFVFNDGGQVIDVEDLLVGCRVRDDDHPREEPIVNPVRDSLATKTTPSTRRVAACVYAPATALSRETLLDLCAEFVALLAECGDGIETAYGVAAPDAQIDV